MLLRKFSITAAAFLLLMPLIGQNAQAANFSTQEVNEIHQFQKKYANLSHKRYTEANIYAKKPHLKKEIQGRSIKTCLHSDAS